MARELGGSQISALLESVPGIANVLRSPVADALVHMIRSGAGLTDFRLEHAKELIQYAERRGLVGSSEADELLGEVTAAAGRRRGSARSGSARSPARAAKPRIRPKPRPKSAATKKKVVKSAKKTAATVGRPVKKAAKGKAVSKGRRR